MNLDATNYDEFQEILSIQAAAGNSAAPPLPVRRESAAVEQGRVVSWLSWGAEPPEFLFLHGGGQNAHTWDRLLVELGRPAIAVDLPGHGRSGWRPGHDYSPEALACDLIVALRPVLKKPPFIVGMSLGGLAGIHFVSSRPHMVAALALIDVTPEVGARSMQLTDTERGATALMRGPRYFAAFEDMVAAASGLNPNRDVESLAIAVRHNAMPMPDGRWTWRHDLGRGASGKPRPAPDYSQLWPELEAVHVPLALVVGARSRFVWPEDVERIRRTHPTLMFASVAGAGHSVQGSHPTALADFLTEFVAAARPMSSGR